MTAPSADVVVVAYHPGGTLRTFLDSVKGAARVATITVVDNAPADEVAPAEAKRAKATYVHTGRNAGYGAGANAGAASGRAEWVVVSNADIVVGEGAIAALVAAGEADPSIGVLGPKVLETDGSVYPSARPLPGLILGAGHAIFGRVWPGNPWTRRYRVELAHRSESLDVGWLSGSFLVVRRSAWDAVGGFDEGFFMFFEDVDLCRRIGAAGWRVVWEPAGTVTHIGGHSYRADPAPMLAAHHASAARYVGLVYPGWWRAPLRAAVKAGLAARQRAEVTAARAARGSRAD